MANLVTDLSSDKSFFVTRQKMAQLGPGCAEAKRSPFSSPPCKASCGPWACVHDGMDGFLTSGLNHATDGRETKQCALIWDFDMCASGDIGNVVIFQCKLWHFLFLGHRENTTSHHQLLFSSNPCYFCPVSFETPEQMLSLWILLLSFKFMVQIFFFFLSLTLCSSRPSGHVSCSRKSTRLPARVPLLESQLLPLSWQCHWLTVYLDCLWYHLYFV